MPITRKNLKATLSQRINTIAQIKRVIKTFKEINPTYLNETTNEPNTGHISLYSNIKLDLDCGLTQLEQERDMFSEFYENQDELTEQEETEYNELLQDTINYTSHLKEILNKLNPVIDELKSEQETEKQIKLEKLKLENDNDLRKELKKMELIANEHTEKLHLNLKEKELKTKEKAIKAKSLPKLPEIPLPQFFGKPTQWLSFITTFQNLIGKQDNIPIATKTHYLLSCLKGDVSDRFKGYDATEANYQIILDILEDTYGNKQDIIELRLQAIENLESPRGATRRESIHNLIKFRDQLEDHLRSLEALNVDVDTILMALNIRRKFPENLKLEFQKYKALNYNDSDLSVKLIRDFITYQIKIYTKALDITELQSNLSKPEQQSTKSSDSNWRRPNQFRAKSSSPMYSSFKHIKNPPNVSNSQRTEYTSTILTTNESNKQTPTQNYRKCLFCGKESHRSLSCPEFSDIYSRRQEIENQKRCIFCLSKEHITKRCDRIGQCYFCKETHNTSLCPYTFPLFPENENLTENDTEPTLPEENENVDIDVPVSTELNMDESSSNNELNSRDHDIPHDQFVLMTETQPENVKRKKYSTTVMQTATCQAYNCSDRNLNNKLHIILDSASGRTYITEDMAQKLNLTPQGTDYIVVNTFSTENPKRIKTIITSLYLELYDESLFYIKAHIVPTITGSIIRPELPTVYKNLPNNLKLADSIPDGKSITLDLLIGDDYFWKLILPQRKSITNHPDLFLIGSKLGWIVTGKTELDTLPKNTLTDQTTLTLLIDPIQEYCQISTNIQPSPSGDYPIGTNVLSNGNKRTSGKSSTRTNIQPSNPMDYQLVTNIQSLPLGNHQLVSNIQPPLPSVNYQTDIQPSSSLDNQVTNIPPIQNVNFSFFGGESLIHLNELIMYTYKIDSLHVLRFNNITPAKKNGKLQLYHLQWKILLQLYKIEITNVLSTIYSYYNLQLTKPTVCYQTYLPNCLLSTLTITYNLPNVPTV